MAADDPTPDEAPRCPPCRGTGRVVSRLGGSNATITCPWCEGTGHVLPGHDAQARWTARGSGDDDGPDAA
jgi:DnaJ-class molecular chaperone